MLEQIDIVIADDHPLFRTGLRQVIENVPGLCVVAEAGDGRTALEQIRKLQPRIAVLDLEMPEVNGLDAARCIVSEKLPTSVIILTMYNDKEMFNEAMDIGVLGYILKDSASMDVVKGIQAVVRGEYFVSPALSHIALQSRESRSTASEHRLGLLLLTPSERRILKMVADNMTSAEIAELLSISTRTVDHHRNSICHKLKLNGINALLRFALNNRAQL
jgi:DNA-binding NarL/FixJ family response regulator